MMELIALIALAVIAFKSDDIIKHFEKARKDSLTDYITRKKRGATRDNGIES